MKTVELEHIRTLVNEHVPENLRERAINAIDREVEVNRKRWANYTKGYRRDDPPGDLL